MPKTLALLIVLVGLKTTLVGQPSATHYIATPIDFRTYDGSPAGSWNARFFSPRTLGENGVLAGAYRVYNSKEFAAVTGPDMRGVFALGGLWPTPRPAPIEVTGVLQDAWGTSSGLFNDRSSSAVAINRTSQVAGSAGTHVDGIGYVARAFLTGPNGIGMRDLGLPSIPGVTHTFATGVNDSGQVTGYVTAYYGGISGGFITGPNGVGIRPIESASEIIEPRDINSFGRVVGTTRDGIPRAFISGPDGVGLTILGTLGGGATPESFWSEAQAVNSLGQVAGNSSVLGNDMQAFVTGPGGVGMVGLGTLGGGFSAASDINDMGQVVGWSYVDNATAPTQRAFLYHPDLGGMVDLNSLVSIGNGRFLEEAIAINGTGQILAAGGGISWLLTPVAVPELSQWTSIFAGGLCGWFVWRLKSRWIS